MPYRQEVAADRHLFGYVGRIPGFLIVIPGLPVNAVLLCQKLVGFPDPGAFDTSQLLDATSLWGGLSKADLVHLPDHLEAEIIIQRKLGLIEQSIGASATGLATGVQANTRFTDPHQQCSRSGRQVYGRMRYPGTRLQHDACDGAHRNMHADAILINDDKRPVLHVDLSVLDKDHRYTIFHGQRPDGRKQR